MMDETEVIRLIGVLREEHRNIDESILLAPAADQMQIARLKKQKLKLKDEIAALEDQLIPDIIA